MANRERAGAGAVGSAGSLGLRVGQAVFSSAALLFMSVGVEFFSYTAFWYAWILQINLGYVLCPPNSAPACLALHSQECMRVELGTILPSGVQ